MEINTTIEVKAFADFDILYTECVMVHFNKFDTRELFSEFYKLEGITSFNELNYKNKRDVTENFIAFLELKGFQKLKTIPIYFCD